MTTAPVAEATELTLELRGGNQEVFAARDHEILVEGPAGTGKTRTILELINALCHKYDGLRALIVRRYGVTLTTTCLQTLRNKVLNPLDGVTFFGGSKEKPAAFTYGNGSTITVGGMDSPTLILSSEYDIIYVNEATELTLEAWETLQGRARPPGVLKRQRIIGDCNPSFDRHWLLKRCQEGHTRRIRTVLQDNPAYYTEDGTLTEDGRAYIEESLAGMTGTRYQRLVLGEWVGMENAVYPQLDYGKDMLELTGRETWGVGTIGTDYGRVHNSAVTAVRRDSAGIVWVRESWAEPGGNPDIIEDQARSMKTRFGIRRGRTDPLQEVLAHNLNFNVAKSGAGSRKGRIALVTALLDAGALKFDRNGKGIPELYEEMQGYRYEIRETDTDIDDVVIRKDDDRVAALEYAIEELMAGEGDPYAPERVPVAFGSRRAPVPTPKHVGGLW